MADRSHPVCRRRWSRGDVDVVDRAVRLGRASAAAEAAPPDHARCRRISPLGSPPRRGDGEVTVIVKLRDQASLATAGRGTARPTPTRRRTRTRATPRRERRRRCDACSTGTGPEDGCGRTPRSGDRRNRRHRHPRRDRRTGGTSRRREHHARCDRRRSRRNTDRSPRTGDQPDQRTIPLGAGRRRQRCARRQPRLRCRPHRCGPRGQLPRRNQLLVRPVRAAHGRAVRRQWPRHGDDGGDGRRRIRRYHDRGRTRCDLDRGADLRRQRERDRERRSISPCNGCSIPTGTRRRPMLPRSSTTRGRSARPVATSSSSSTCRRCEPPASCPCSPPETSDRAPTRV